MDSGSISQVRAQFETLLLQPLLEPIESALGGYADIAAQPFGEALAKALAQ